MAMFHGACVYFMNPETIAISYELTSGARPLKETP
jgi:hypothetical protein